MITVTALSAMRSPPVPGLCTATMPATTTIKEEIDVGHTPFLFLVRKPGQVFQTGPNVCVAPGAAVPDGGCADSDTDVGFGPFVPFAHTGAGPWQFAPTTMRTSQDRVPTAAQPAPPASDRQFMQPRDQPHGWHHPRMTCESGVTAFVACGSGATSFSSAVQGGHADAFHTLSYYHDDHSLNLPADRNMVALAQGNKGVPPPHQHPSMALRQMMLSDPSTHSAVGAGDYAHEGHAKAKPLVLDQNSNELSSCVSSPLLVQFACGCACVRVLEMIYIHIYINNYMYIIYLIVMYIILY